MKQLSTCASLLPLLDVYSDAVSGSEFLKAPAAVAKAAAAALMAVRCLPC